MVMVTTDKSTRMPGDCWGRGLDSLLAIKPTAVTKQPTISMFKRKGLKSNPVHQP